MTNRTANQVHIRSNQELETMIAHMLANQNDSGTLFFGYDEDQKTWCLYGETNRIVWETDDYQAENEADAKAQALAYLEAWLEQDKQDNY